MITNREIKLGQTRYFILQYIRGSSSNVFDVTEMAKTLELSERTVKEQLGNLRAMGVISDNYCEKYQLRTIEVEHEWQ